MANVISLDLVVDDKGTATISKASSKAITAFDRMENKASGAADKMRRNFGRLGDGISSIGKRLTSLKTLAVGALAGWGLKKLVSGAFEVASSFEKMQMSLDTITKGKGAETLERLNEWAMKMPVNTQKAIETFSMLQALGLKPTTEMMTTLVDTTIALGGGADKLQGIARALGQIQAKGRVSSEELMQLTEQLVPASEILQKKLGLTAGQVAEIGKQGISASATIKALFEGMTERFGGLSEKMRNTWGGMMEEMKATFVEFIRKIMDSGPFNQFKNMLRTALDQIKPEEMKAIAEKTGKYIGETVESVVKGITDTIEKGHEILNAFRWSLAKIMEKLQESRAAILEWRIEEFGSKEQGQVARGKIGTGDVVYTTRELNTILNSLRNSQAQWAAVAEDTSRTYTKQKQTISSVKNKIDEIVRSTKVATMETKKLAEASHAIITNPRTGQTWSFSGLTKANKSMENIAKSASDASHAIMESATNTYKWSEALNKVIVEPKIKKSPAQPWAEGIAEMRRDLEAVGSGLTATMDMSGVASLVNAAQASIRAIRDFGPLTSEALYQAHAGESTKQAYAESKKLLELQMNILRQIAGGGTTINVNGGGQDANSLARSIKQELDIANTRGL